MAKLSARGAEVVERFVVADAHYVLCSDRRVLVACRHAGKWDGYKLLARGVSQAAWERFKARYSPRAGSSPVKS